jgi:2-methylcitrate dehydratase
VLIRYLDFNDGYIGLGSGHPSDTLAALLPCVEIAGGSGRDLIVATAIAYEVFTKIMDVLDTRGLGLDQSTVLGLAALAGAGRLMGLSEEQMVNAIGITTGGNTAINQGRVGTLSNWKDYACPEACRKAIFALQLAQAGMTGPRDVFEGRDGFFNVISRKAFDLPPLGQPFGILRALTKRFALGQYSQTVAQAAVEARSFITGPDDIAEVNVRVSHSAIKIMADGPDKWRPQTHETADHSMPYAVGVILMHGTIEDRHYEDEHLHDPRLLEMVSRVRCIPSEEADRREREINLCDLELVLRTGERRSVRVEYHRGHWKNPLTDAELEEKFRALAGRRLPAGRIGALLDGLWRLDDLARAAALIPMTIA